MDNGASMGDNRTSLEVIAPSVEEAIAKGLADLGLTEDVVDVEVLDSGSKGLFGIGFRQARVRLTIKYLAQATEAEVKFDTEPPAPEMRPATSTTTEKISDTVEPAPVAPGLAEKPAKSEQEAMSKEEELTLHVARETVEELLERMNVRARVSVRRGEPEDDKDRAPVQVDVRGDDLSILIGPKAETLNALQYIAGLIVSKEIGKSVPLVVDVEGYRARRAQQIRQLARRMAEQAVRTGRRQVLEPMPANERRLVHIELRDHPQVLTESIGEEPRRKVTIVPK
jgi:spoIIIJ-associated protein